MEKLVKNIVIGKLGKSVKMKNIHIETGGGADLVLYSSLSRMNPDFNFYFIGPNELHKCTQEEYDKLFPNHNVFSAWERKAKDDVNLIYEYFVKNNIKVDFSLIFVGMCSGINIKGFLKKKDGNYYSPLMCFQNYAAPIINTLNKLECPVYTLAEDARYITINAKDLYNRERLIFSQINGDFKTTIDHVLNSNDLDTCEFSTHKAIYSHLEKIFLMGLDEHWKENIDINHKLNNTGNHFIVLSNGCGTNTINKPGTYSSRLGTYKKYIIDNFKGTKYEDTKIYGIWDDEIYSKYPQIQNKLMMYLGDEINDAKYTLVYSQAPGFVTCKPWEMITIGLIPFIHPDYDCYHLLDLPEYLYIKDENDLLHKVEELENNPDKYKKLLQECFDSIKPEFLDGSYLNNFIFKTIGKDLGFEYEDKKGIKSIFNRFSKEFIQ